MTNPVDQQLPRLQCVYTGADLRSRFANLSLDYPFAAKSGMAFWTDLFPCQSWKSARLEPGARGWHPNPNPALSIVLEGHIETTVGVGETRVSSPGGMGMSLDVLGPGHRTNVLGPQVAYVFSLMLRPDDVARLSTAFKGWPTDMNLPTSW